MTRTILSLVAAALVFGFAPGTVLAEEERPGVVLPDDRDPKGAPLAKNPTRKKPDAATLKREHQKLVTSLLSRLSSTDDERSAEILEKAVWKAWTRSGSPTVDLLMQQVNKAAHEKKPDYALEILDAVVEIAPDYVEGWNRRATMLYLSDQFNESILNIKRVLELEPRHFGALSGLGVIMREMGNDRGALSAFREALKHHPFLKDAIEAVKELSETVEGRGI